MVFSVLALLSHSAQKHVTLKKYFQKSTDTELLWTVIFMLPLVENSTYLLVILDFFI